ncbi:hypothetical protein EVA_15599 [gut metagenome]|uniref:Uncharacterized protein n=1 Tax=gut metagenome TaxID=749906 RepID=J9G3A2_9ZZZZ
MIIFQKTVRNRLRGLLRPFCLRKNICPCSVNLTYRFTGRIRNCGTEKNIL